MNSRQSDQAQLQNGWLCFATNGSLVGDLYREPGTCTLPPVYPACTIRKSPLAGYDPEFEAKTKKGWFRLDLLHPNARGLKFCLFFNDSRNYRSYGNFFSEIRSLVLPTASTLGRLTFLCCSRGLVQSPKFFEQSLSLGRFNGTSQFKF